MAGAGECDEVQAREGNDIIAKRAAANSGECAAQVLSRLSFRAPCLCLHLIACSMSVLAPCLCLLLIACSLSVLALIACSKSSLSVLASYCFLLVSACFMSVLASCFPLETLFILLQSFGTGNNNTQGVLVSDRSIVHEHAQVDKSEEAARSELAAAQSARQQAEVSMRQSFSCFSLSLSLSLVSLSLSLSLSLSCFSLSLSLSLCLALIQPRFFSLSCSHT